MSSYILSVGLNGLKGQVIKVEATVRSDKEQCIIIGLPDGTIKESRERILNSLHSLGLDIEMKKITINLSPADVKKSWTGFDGAMLLASFKRNRLMRMISLFLFQFIPTN